MFDPLAPDAVVGLPNPLAESAERDRLVDQLASMLMRSWDFASAPRSVALTQTSLFTLARAGGCAVVDLPELLTNPVFRHKVLGRITDQTGLTSFWGQFEEMSEGERAEVVAPTLNRTRSWLLHRDVRHVLGQVESTWHMDAVLDGGVLLVSLARGALGDELAALLGSLLIGDLLAAVRRRVRRAQSRRAPAVVILDEFQHLHALAEGFADDLVTAGGMGVGFVMAHQHLAQLGPNLKEAVLANARSRLVFQLSSSDAATQRARAWRQRVGPTAPSRLSRHRTPGDAARSIRSGISCDRAVATVTRQRSVGSTRVASPLRGFAKSHR